MSEIIIRTHNLGYPRIGERRELKKATEAYWKGTLTLEELLETGRRLRAGNWKKQQEAGIGLIPVNDFSFYDQMLDMSCLLGCVPPRFGQAGTLDYPDNVFTIARGLRPGSAGAAAAHAERAPGEDCACGHTGSSMQASEMTKWFDTNYHYLVPELDRGTVFRLSGTKIFDEFDEARALGVNAKPVLIGPVTWLLLGKVRDAEHPDFDPLSLLDSVLGVYEEIIRRLAAAGAEWIQLDEPVLSLDLTDRQRAALVEACTRLASVKGTSRLIVATFFGPLRDNLGTFLSLPVEALHFDLVRGAGELETVLADFPAEKILSAGIVDGRNIWRNDYDASLAVLMKAWSTLGPDRVWLAPSCSLIHVPVTLANESGLDPELKSWLAFADEKLAELTDLRQLMDDTGGAPQLAASRAAAASRRGSPRIHNPAVRTRLEAVREQDFDRASPFVIRQAVQAARLQLPEFPTTTIGSFPQTPEVRQARARWRKGELSGEAYEAFLREETARCIAWQDAIGIDMPVHGEFERNDMVEHFGELLEGFAFTAHGWVQSYGSRCVKPPVIFGDVSRPAPMTVRWSAFAQSLTTRPMKGMLTGPVTILQWSFVRDDQPRRTTAWQIALAIRDEVLDLEAAGIPAIQIDEPALREGLPLRHADRAEYLHWAVRSFRLSAAGVRDGTQIHTHMCYCEFNDIIRSIADLDADVITIETSRSNMELLNAFSDFQYPNGIGPGVYDIHSPRVPSAEEMVRLLRRAEAVLPRRNLWVNPDCGLKTRGWEEVRPALMRMTSAARTLRASPPALCGEATPFPTPAHAPQ